MWSIRERGLKEPGAWSLEPTLPRSDIHLFRLRPNLQADWPKCTVDKRPVRPVGLCVIAVWKLYRDQQAPGLATEEGQDTYILCLPGDKEART
jgi:hypothetical protein